MRTFTLLSLLCCTHLLPAQTFSWARQLGGTLAEFSNSMVTDAAGNVYTTGEFEGTLDADPGPGTFSLTSAGSKDIFISKTDAAGNFIWAKQIGGTHWDAGYSLAVGASGSIYITGRFSFTVDFDPGEGEFLMTPLPAHYESCYPIDAFILKLDAAGDFIWARQLGGNGADHGSALALDADESVYVVGEYVSYDDVPIDLDPTEGTYYVSSPNWAGAFMLKLDTDGGFVWAGQWESWAVSAVGACFRDGMVNPASITIDGAGNIISTGHFVSRVDWDPGEGVYYNVNSSNNVYVLKLTGGGDFIWVRYLTNSDNGHAWGRDVATDAANNVITVGTFDGSFDFDPGTGVKTLKAPGSSGPNGIGPRDAFIWKLTSAGNYFWAGQLGGNTGDGANSVDIDANGNIYTTGTFTGTADFDPSTKKTTLKSAGADDVFISKLTAAGVYTWAVRIGSTGSEAGNEIDIDAANNILVSGGFPGTVDFNPGGGTYNMTSYGGVDIFILKLNQGSALQPSDEEIVTRSASSPELNLYPNPAIDQAVLSFTSDIEQPYEIMLADISGKIIRTHSDTAVKGDNLVMMHLHDVVSGMYYLLWKCGERSESRKLVVEK